MSSLQYGAIFIGAFLSVTGGSTAFLIPYQSQLQTFSLCCVVLGSVLLILGLFRAMNSKTTTNYNHPEFDPECPRYRYNEYLNFCRHARSPPGCRCVASQSASLQRTSECHRCGAHRENFDCPPIDQSRFSSTPNPLPLLGSPPLYDSKDHK